VANGELTSAVGEPVVAGPTVRTGAPDHVRLASALSSELLALETRRSVGVALTAQGTVVVVGGQRIDGLFAETRRRGAVAKDQQCVR
jgi:hypothetical protein